MYMSPELEVCAHAAARAAYDGRKRKVGPFTVDRYIAGNAIVSEVRFGRTPLYLIRNDELVLPRTAELWLAPLQRAAVACLARLTSIAQPVPQRPITEPNTIIFIFFDTKGEFELYQRQLNDFDSTEAIRRFIEETRSPQCARVEICNNLHPALSDEQGLPNPYYWGTHGSH